MCIRDRYHTEWPTDRRIEALPFDIMPGEVGNIRNDIFLERAIVGERLRLSLIHISDFDRQVSFHHAQVPEIRGSTADYSDESVG